MLFNFAHSSHGLIFAIQYQGFTHDLMVLPGISGFVLAGSFTGYRVDSRKVATYFERKEDKVWDMAMLEWVPRNNI